jgi:predicted SprT family Zn-dependent metalloprotease
MDYSLTNNTIRINPVTFSMQSTDKNIRTLMHEIVHAYTVSSIYRVK